MNRLHHVLAVFALGLPACLDVPRPLEPTGPFDAQPDDDSGMTPNTSGGESAEGDRLPPDASAGVQTDAGLSKEADGGVLERGGTFDAGTMGGETCDTATWVFGPNVRIRSTTAEAQNDTRLTRSKESGCRGASEHSTAPDVVYRISVPPEQALAASVDASWDTVLNLLAAPASCAPVDGGESQCLAGADALTGAGHESAHWFNDTGRVVDVLVVVDGYSDGSGPFELSLSVFQPPDGNACTSAKRVAVFDGGTRLENQTLDGFASFLEASALCAFGKGPERVYAVTIPPRERLTATVRGSADLMLSVLSTTTACASPSVARCEATADRFQNQDASGRQSEVLTLTNHSALAKEVLLVVDSRATPEFGSTFELFFETTPPAPGDACENTTVLQWVDGGVFAPSQTLAGYADDYAQTTSNCIMPSGVDRAYQVTVPPNQGLEVVAKSQTDLTVNLLVGASACFATPRVCIASSDAALTGSATSPAIERLVFNNGNTTTDVTILIDSVTTVAPPGTFDLELKLVPTPYVMSVASAPCESLGPAVVSLLDGTSSPVIDDDVMSAVQKLPFDFSLFGTAVTHFAASSNGFLQLLETASTPTSSASGNDAIPSPGTPNGVIAPFWDDLAPTSHTNSRVVSFVGGGVNDRHLTVQWESMPLYGVPGASVTVQARLFESTHVIELQACSLIGTASSEQRELGHSATSGIESADGRQGVPFSYLTPTLVPGQRIRFSPR